MLQGSHRALEKLTMSLGDIVDQLHNEDSFSHPCTTEETNFPSSLIRCQKIHDLIEVKAFYKKQS
jgi:hypothetical protein